MILKIS